MSSSGTPFPTVGTHGASASSVRVSCKVENAARRERRARQREMEAEAKEVLSKEFMDIDVDVSPPLCPAAPPASALLPSRKPPSAPPATDNDPMSEWAISDDWMQPEAPETVCDSLQLERVPTSTGSAGAWSA